MRLLLASLVWIAPCLAAAVSAGCSSRPEAVDATGAREAVEGAASSDPGPLLATIPASAAGIDTWSLYATTADDGSATLTVRGLDGSGGIFSETVLLPDASIAGVGSVAGLGPDQANALAQSMAADFGALVAQNDPAAGASAPASLHLQDNLFGWSDCTWAIVQGISSLSSTVGGVVASFATCPVTVGVGCVAGVVMTISSAAFGAYVIDKAAHTCSQAPPSPLATCQAACGRLGTTYPDCMKDDPFSGCYDDCANGADDARAAFASCVASALSGGAPSDCGALTSCFAF